MTSLILRTDNLLLAMSASSNFFSKGMILRLIIQRRFDQKLEVSGMPRNMHEGKVIGSNWTFPDDDNPFHGVRYNQYFCRTPVRNSGG